MNSFHALVKKYMTHGPCYGSSYMHPLLLRKSRCLQRSRILAIHNPLFNKLTNSYAGQAIAYETHSGYSIDAWCTTLAYAITNALQSCCCLLLQKNKEDIRCKNVKELLEKWFVGRIAQETDDA